jgi:hypothetical protein
MSMRSRAAVEVYSGTYSPLMHTRTGRLQRKCACGGIAGPTGECEECRKKRLALNRKTRQSEPTPGYNSANHPSVDEVVQSPGQPLDGATRAFMEPRFGHDFSQVRVHTDERASESVRAVDALAYTVGRHMVFGSDQYVPTTTSGRRLIAHELTHVLQQARSGTPSAHRFFGGTTEADQEREAESHSERVVSEPTETHHVAIAPISASSGRLQRQPQLPGPPPLQGQINMTVDDQGRVSLSVSGPQNVPVVKQPTIGIRRDPNGKYHLLVGGQDKLVSVDQIPALLRSAVGQAGTPGGKIRSPAIRVPSCSQLMTLDGMRFKTFAEHRMDRILNPNWLDLTPALYDALVEACQPVQPDVPRPEPHEALPPVVPEGMAVA